MERQEEETQRRRANEVDRAENMLSILLINVKHEKSRTPVHKEFFTGRTTSCIIFGNVVWQWVVLEQK